MGPEDLGYSDAMRSTRGMVSTPDNGWTIYGSLCQLALSLIGLFLSLIIIGPFILEIIGLATLIILIGLATKACQYYGTSRSMFHIIGRSKRRARILRRLSDAN